MSRPTILHLADPGDRRAVLFAQAADRGGFNVQHLTWSAAALGGVGDVGAHCQPTWVRLDSPPPSAASLIGPVDIYGLAHLDDLHLAVIGVFQGLSARWGEPALTSPTAVVAATFDKSVCHRSLQAADVAVAPRIEGCFDTFAELASALETHRCHRVFVKPRFGSSASGVVAVHARDGRVEIVTSMTRNEAGELVNRLGLSRYTGRLAVSLLDQLLATCAVHVERWVPKAIVDGRATDLRVVTIAGEPCHTVVRASKGPITNLQAGNSQLPTHLLRAQVGDDSWESMLATCRTVAATFRPALHLGIDIAFSQSGSRHAVLEVNAFGDLLPRALHFGQTTYELEVAALQSGRFEQWRAGSSSARPSPTPPSPASS